MPPERKIKKYPLEDMKKAVDAVRLGMSVASASKLYKVPRITLLYKVKGKFAVDCRMGPETQLTRNEEERLVNWLFTIADAGFPATRLQLLDSVQLLMRKLNRENKFKDNRPGKKWFQCFLKRHPQVTQRLTQNLTRGRSELSEERLRGWFQEVKTYVETKNLQEVFLDPKRVFNTDETAFFLCPKGSRCLVRKGDKTAYSFSGNDEKECLTTLMTANAAGMIAPPMIMFSYERIPTSIVSSMPKDWGVGKSESGWMTGSSFYEFIANIFHPWLVVNKIDLPVVLFVDGHSSHLTMSLSNFCVENKIELIVLFPNSTHILLQPMDVAVFSPLKKSWKQGVQKFKFENDGRKLRRENFGQVLQDVIEKSITPDIIKNGFRTCGLFPLDPDAVPYKKFFKQTSTLINKDQNGESNQNIPTREYLTFFEQQLGEEKLNSFKEIGDGLRWDGDVEDTSLFMFWKTLVTKLHGSHDSITHTPVDTNNPQPGVVQREEELSRKIVILENKLLQSPKPGTSKSILADVPSPFTSSLFWPKPTEQTKSKRVKEKIPSVATSDQWRSYYKKKEDEKQRKIAEKEERKRKREEKKKEKETQMQNKKIAKKKQESNPKYEFSSDSSVDVILESEGDGDDWDKISENSTENTQNAMADFKIGDYVIIKYDDAHYPGEIVAINSDVNEFRISTMVKSGILDWKWPEHADLVWYKHDALMKKIKAPMKKNARGIFTIPEMHGFSTVFYKL